MPQLNHTKGSERFVIKYELGEEARVLDELVELVHRKDVIFDWYDAACLSHQLGQNLARELKRFIPKPNKQG